MSPVSKDPCWMERMSEALVPRRSVAPVSRLSCWAGKGLGRVQSVLCSNGAGNSWEAGKWGLRRPSSLLLMSLCVYLLWSN